MPLYENQFDEAHNYPPAETKKTLIIASTVRSGSHMLGHALHATGAFGFPLEYVNKQNLAQWQKIFGTATLEDTLRQIKRYRTSPNGVFGIKVHYSHLKQSCGGFASLLELLPDPHFVLLTREDVMAQAVSLAVARQTGNWIAGQTDVKTEPTYNFEDIDNSLRRILFENASWRYTLAASGCRYMELNFADVKSHISSAVSRIADFMQVDVDPNALPDAPVTKKQGHSLNEQWMKMFRSQFTADTELMRYNQESLPRRLYRRFF